MKQLLATAALGLLLSACQVVGPDYTLPDKAAGNRGDLQGQVAGEGNSVVGRKSVVQGNGFVSPVCQVMIR